MTIRLLIVATALLLSCALTAQAIKINEIMANNQSTLPNTGGQYADWLELFNSSADTVQLAGYFLSDQPSQPYKWRITDTVPAQTAVPPLGHLVVWCDDNTPLGALHTNFKLSADGETVWLTAPDSTLQDSVNFGPQLVDVSWARLPDGGPVWRMTAPASPGAPNDSLSVWQATAAAPFSPIPSGFYPDSVVVTLYSPTPNARIYYRLDGKTPTETDSLYNGPFTIYQNTALRARAYAQGYSRSPWVAYDWLIETPGTFATVALNFDPADFFDTLTGIYTNYNTLYDAERPVHVAWFEPDGTPGFSGRMEVELQGIASLQNPQKSLLLKVETNSGLDTVAYPILGNETAPAYDRFILRNSGQDWNVTQFRDAFVTDLGRNYDDLKPILDTLHVQFQGFRPGLVYFNGQYQGIHNIREAMGKNFLRDHYGVTNADLIEDYSRTNLGDSVAWMQMLQWLSANRIHTAADFDSLAVRNHMPNFTDYVIYQIVADNVDWPIKNWRRFRARQPDGKWTWLPYDFDLTCGLLLTNGGWNTSFAGQNAIARAIDSSFTFFSTPDWSTLPLRRALEYPPYRVDFLNRLADLLNTVFRYERVTQRLDSFHHLYAPEMLRHSTRWGGGDFFIPIWEENIAKMDLFWQQRADSCFAHAVQTFHTTTTNTHPVTLAVTPTGAGHLHWSTLTLGQAHLPWTGTYFGDVPIQVAAIPQAGWHFVRWSGAALGDSSRAVVVLNDSLHLVAEFAQDSVPPTIDTTEEFWEQVMLFPNPTTDYVHLKTPAPLQSVALYDMNGRALSWGQHWSTVGTMEYRLDLKALPPAAYWLEIAVLGQKKRRKVVQRL